MAIHTLRHARQADDRREQMFGHYTPIFPENQEEVWRRLGGDLPAVARRAHSVRACAPRQVGGFCRIQLGGCAVCLIDHRHGWPFLATSLTNFGIIVANWAKIGAKLTKSPD